MDNRVLNAVTIKDKYPLPNHEDLTDQLAEATSTWYLGQVMMPPRTSGYLSESCNIVGSC